MGSETKEFICSGCGQMVAWKRKVWLDGTSTDWAAKAHECTCGCKPGSSMCFCRPVPRYVVKGHCTK